MARKNSKGADEQYRERLLRWAEVMVLIRKLQNEIIAAIADHAINREDAENALTSLGACQCDILNGLHDGR